MVFLFGGGYLFGSSDVLIYGPDFLISKDVILVTFNYRLGIFGEFSPQQSVITSLVLDGITYHHPILLKPFNLVE